MRRGISGSQGWRSIRGQSNAIAVVLLAGMVLAGATVVVVAGSTAINQAQSESSFSTAEQSMRSLGAEIDSVSRSGEMERLSLQGFDDGDATIDESAGTVTITIEKSGDSHSVSKDLGTIEYEQDGRSLAYQSGGVFEKTGNGSVVLSSPTVGYQTTGGDPTLNIALVSVTGESIDGEVKLNRSRVSDLVAKLDGDPSTDKGPPGHGDDQEEDLNPLPRGATLTITVESEYYQAWGSAIEQNVGATTNYDHTNEQVSLVMKTPPEVTTGKVTGSLISGRGTTNLFDKGPTIDSYSGTYSPSPPDKKNGDVYAKEIPFRNSPDIYGDVRVEKLPKKIMGDIDVYGDTYLGSYKNTIATKGRFQASGGKVPHFHGDVHVDDWMVLADVNIDGDYVTSSRLTAKGWGHATIGGSVYAWGRRGSNDAKLDDITIEEDLYVIGDINVGRDVVVHGKVRATGKIKKANKIENEHGNTHSDVREYVSKASIKSEMTKRQKPNVPTRSSVSSEIDSRKTTYSQPANNNNGMPLTDGGEVTCEKPSVTSCELTAGNYDLDSLVIDDGEDLELDTTSGNINIYVENKVVFDGTGTTVEIVGDGRVNVFVGGDKFRVTNGADVVNHDDSAKQFWVYMRPDGDVDLSHDDPSDASVFKGVVYAPGGTSNPGAKVAIEGNAEVYGAVVGHVTTVTESGGNDPQIHYDQSLMTASLFNAGTSSSDPRVFYLQTSAETVSVS